MAANPSHPNVAVFPPLLPLGGMLTGVVLEQLAPTSAWLPRSSQPWLRGSGVALLVIGVVGFASMVIAMKRARTPIHTAKTPTALVESGPFRITRNPMYLFGAVAYAGLSLSLALVWPLALLPLVQVATHHLIVLREEQYLAHVFGDAYRRYCARVPRWV